MRIKALVVKVFIMMLGSSIFLNPNALAQSQPSPSQREAAAHYGALPLTFETNQGQTGALVKFLSKGKGYTAFLTANGMILSLRPAAGVARQPVNAPASASQPSTILQFALVGAAANPAVTGEEMQPGKINYFIGNDPSQWRRNVATYGRIRYHNVYPGIDMIYYGNHRQLEYDFAISPGANPSQIQFQIKGANGIYLEANGDLALDTGNGVLHFKNPTIYQESNGAHVPVLGGYVIQDSSHVGFHLSSLDPTKATVIDPVLVYGTFLGGSGDDQASGIAVDASGNVYISGTTDSTDFPLGVLGSLPAGSPHVFVAKLDATGSTLLYADYLGGNVYDYGYALAIDSAGEVYVTGTTASSNFPTTVNAYQGSYPGGFNGFLTEISADGSTLEYSTYLGGNGSDWPASIAIDSFNDILVAGSTTSTNFPVANAYQSSASANQGGKFGTYGFLTKFSAGGSTLVYSTYFAGNTNVAPGCGSPSCWPAPYSAIAAVTVDSTGNAYVGGNTNTYNFPTTSGVYQTSSNAPQNNSAGFLAKFSLTGTLTYSTYFDETSGIVTIINGVAVDSSGSAYATGGAYSDGTFPITSTSICDPAVSGPYCGYAFVTKFDPAAASLVYSTFLGPNNLSTAISISIDGADNAYILGSTNDTSFGLANGIEGFSTEGSQYQAGVDYDVILAEIDPTGTTELFATYIGGSGNNSADAMALDASANIYVAGTTDSIDFPVTQGSFQEVIGGNTDGFIVKVSPADAAAVSVVPFSLDYSTQALGTASAAQTVLLRNMGSAALNISSITSPSGFTQTNDCGTSVPAAGTCTLSVTFAPSAAGSASGNVSIVDDAAGSPHVISLSGFATGALVALSPASLTFTGLTVGTASPEQTVTLSNNGNASLNISGIQVSGDYAQTNTCGASLAASASCQIQITFTPTAAGNRTGALTIADDAFNSPQTLALTGTGEAALGITLSASTLTFANQPVDSTSSTQTLTVTNHALSSAVVSSVSITGNFSQTNNCGTVTANGGSCSVTVKFAPSASGASTGTLKITTSAGISQTVSLSGTGVDFSVASSSSSDTIQEGSTATYKLTVSPVGGSFASAIQLSCSGQPDGTTCAFSPSSVTPGASPASVTMTIATTASTSQALPRRSSHSYAFAAWMQLPGLGLFGIVFAGSKRRSKKAAMLVVLVLVITGLLFLSACAGGTGIAPQSQNGQTGTQIGTYNVSATGTSGNLKHSVPLTLNVQ
jgi:Beta-propeller repeat/Abnormal spindle-like microcephaly-assoc'd, ASPM-SPD-2-Hydin